MDYIEKNIQTFHKRRIDKLYTLKLKTVLKRKNPYLYKAKNTITAADLIKGIMDAFLISQEEGIFGDFLEGLAIFINEKTYSGKKSGIPGIDLEFQRDNIRYLVNIKSGPNWGNSRQIKKMREDFIKAKQTLKTSGSKLQVEVINGCCYGRENKEEKGDYMKICGESFWTFISGNASLYTEIIEPLGHQAKQRNDDFQKEYVKVVNKFTSEFINEFCLNDYSIDWQKLVRFTSSKSGKY